MLCNALIQPHFDYACPAWYPSLNEKTKKNTHNAKQMHKLAYKMHHISEEEFRLINWFPTSKKVDQYINITTYNFVNNTCPYYLNEIFELTSNQFVCLFVCLFFT